MGEIKLRYFAFLLLSAAFFLPACGGGGGDDNPMPPPNLEGSAITGIEVVDGGLNSTPPAANPGYTLLDIDLNDGTGGDYIWLYYKVGPADGSEGTPIGEIYTVDEFDHETPTKGGTKIPVNLNAGPTIGHDPLWLYYINSSWPVARCVVVANETKKITKYGPPEAEGKYPVVWVKELLPDDSKTPSEFPEPADAQDLNEGESFPPFFISDWIFIGYCVDQEVYDWLQ